MNADQYCREVESYLCQKNDGHLIRIVGPAFELVSSWAARGIPLKVTCRGVDRYFERYYAKGPRRRPVRIDFCEADVLDAFDEWRRAVGIRSIDPEPSARQRTSLSQHLERVIARLSVRRAGGKAAVLDEAIEGIVRELDAQRARAKALRGEARTAFLERLDVLDRLLIDTAVDASDDKLLAELDREANEELAAFRDRMAEATYAQALIAARDRLLRERLGLPSLSYHQ